MNSAKLISTGRTLAIISFLGGTAILLMFYYTDNTTGLGIIGLGYLIIICLINLIVLGLLLFNNFKYKERGKEVLKTIGLMLLNIPIAIFYCWLAIALLNTVRITFVNETSSQLDNIKIAGCENKRIDLLKVGQSKTVWIHIPNDCGVSISYKLNGQKKTEDVTGYVTNEGGYIMTFKIGTNQRPYDQDL
jgi:hypothetical protein